MREPQQPICKGTDENGELVWGFIPMPRWQQAMFPVKYVGDFFKFWMLKAFTDQTGHEPDANMPSMNISKSSFKSKYPRKHHSGD